MQKKAYWINKHCVCFVQNHVRAFSKALRHKIVRHKKTHCYVDGINGKICSCNKDSLVDFVEFFSLDFTCFEF